MENCRLLAVSRPRFQGKRLWCCVSVVKEVRKTMEKCRCSQFANNLNMNRSKIHEKSYKIAPKSTPSRSQIDENVPLGRFGSQVAPMSAPGRSPEFGVLGFWMLFGRNCQSNGCFWGPLGIENCSKITWLRTGWNLEPPKMPSWRGCRKNMKK